MVSLSHAAPAVTVSIVGGFGIVSLGRLLGIARRDSQNVINHGGVKEE